MRVPVIVPLLTVLTFAQAPTAPASLKPPEGQRLRLQAHGVGVQIYECSHKEGGFAWVLQGPEAKLLDSQGRTVGKHFAGPTWQTNDGSSVKGKPVATVPSPDARSIPWLLLKTSKGSEAGHLKGVLSIQRLNTQGGKAPATGCDSRHGNETIRVPYQADYLFYSGSAPL